MTDRNGGKSITSFLRSSAVPTSWKQSGVAQVEKLPRGQHVGRNTHSNRLDIISTGVRCIRRRTLTLQLRNEPGRRIKGALHEKHPFGAASALAAHSCHALKRKSAHKKLRQPLSFRGSEAP